MDNEFIRELFSAFGAVAVRRLFGGAGIYADGVMFALVFDGVIYLKADDGSIPLFEGENCAPFGYQTKTGRRVLTSYWRLPERLYDDPDDLARWAQQALAIARRGGQKKPLAKMRKKRL